jgi:phage terminase large subunit-like protein
VWDENAAAPLPLKKKVVYAGLDLSSVSDLCALIAVTEDNDVHCKFWLPEEGLEEKSRVDRTEYDVWAQQGYITTTPGRTIEYEYIAEYLRGLFDICDVRALAFDRYNMKFLTPWLRKVGFTEKELERFVEFGQGFVSMSPALRELETRLLGKKMKHGNNPVLRECAANAVVSTDPAGNRKFNKAKATGRIDGMVALAMAVAASPMKVGEVTKKFQLFFV